VLTEALECKFNSSCN